MPTSPALSFEARRSGVSGTLPWRSALAGSLAMTIAAHVAVPFWPVPMTMQSLAVLMLGATLGPVAGAAAVLAWIGEGIVGLPVFASGVGPATIFGPSGGYIVGYLLAVLIAGVAARRGWMGSIPSAALAFVLAEAALFVAGCSWLATLVGWQHAIAGGLMPFILGEVLKIGLATASVTLLKRHLTRRV